MPRPMARFLSTTVDIIRIAFFGYAAYLTFVLTTKIGRQQMAIIDWPIGLIYAFVLLGFIMMCFRAIQVALLNWRRGYSVLERPEIGLAETL
jgi:TRAP-type transport system small permease protein